MEHTSVMSMQVLAVMSWGLPGRQCGLQTQVTSSLAMRAAGDSFSWRRDGGGADATLNAPQKGRDLP
jgi:hypothetical protein